ncbi:MAG: hypothetical protein ACYC18_06415 [Gammaproteobacteria bacterium]
MCLRGFFHYTIDTVEHGEVFTMPALTITCFAAGMPGCAAASRAGVAGKSTAPVPSPSGHILAAGRIGINGYVERSGTHRFVRQATDRIFGTQLIRSISTRATCR